MFVYATFDKPVTASGQARRQRPADAGYVKFDTTADKTVTMRIATSLISVDQAQAEPRARDRADATRSTRSRDRAQQRGTQARRDRGRGRDRRPADDAVLEPLPAQPLSELGVREHRHGGEPASTSTRCSRRRRADPAEHADADRRAGRRRQGVRQQRLLGHLPDRRGRPTRCSTRRTPARWSTASSSSTATAAGSRAGRRRATRT